jgi:hypothetical protein
MKTIVLSLSIAALVGTGGWAKGEPDLSGTWTLDSARVTRGRAPDCTVATNQPANVESAERRSPGCADRLVITQANDSILIEHTSPLTPAPRPLVTMLKPNGTRDTASGSRLPAYREIMVYTARWQNGSLVVEQTLSIADGAAQSRQAACPTCTDDFNQSQQDRMRAGATWAETTLTYTLDKSRSSLLLEVRSGSNRQERRFVRSSDTPAVPRQ